MESRAARERHRVIVITDMNEWGDDSNALFMLLRSEQVQVDGIITTSGNVWMEQATGSALRVLEKLNRADIPVYRGPPAGNHEDRLKHYRFQETRQGDAIRYAGALAHGESASSRAPLGATTRIRPAAEPGLEYLIRTVLARPGELTAVLIGPATVLAQAIRKEPRVATGLKRVYLMGGAVAVAGNATPHAEFNFWFDPESAREVLLSGVPATVVTLDSTQGAEFDSGVLQRLKRSRHLMAAHVLEYLQKAHIRAPGKLVPMWDEAVAGVLLDPSLVLEDKMARLTVITKRGAFYGASSLEEPGADQKTGSTRVIFRVNAAALKKLFSDLLDG